MSVGEIITYIMLAFAVLGGLDRAFGSRLGLGKAFERGFESMGALVLAMVGLMAAAPLIAQYLAPVLSPFFQAIGIDPSVVAGSLLINDSGGWALAQELAQDSLLGKFFGSVVAAIMGCTIVGAFPMCFMLMPKEKYPLVAKGMTIGFITIPVGCFVGGLCFGISLGTLLLNILPMILFSGLFILGLTFCEKLTLKIVTIMGYIITAVVTLALLISMVLKVTGKEFAGFVPFDECIVIIGSIAIFICGAFTLLQIVEKLFGKGLSRLGKRMGLDDHAFLGLLTTAVNAIPMFAMTKKMSDRGIIVNIAFMVPASYALGDHLAFQAAVDTTTVVPTIAGKLVGGVLAVLLALLLTKPKKRSLES